LPEPSPVLRRLADRLDVGVDRIVHLERLGDPVIEELDALVGRAQSRDEQEIEEGFQQTLRFVPRLLRGRVKKLLFPEDDR
jgi:hypothetical protein